MIWPWCACTSNGPRTWPNARRSANGGLARCPRFTWSQECADRNYWSRSRALPSPDTRRQQRSSPSKGNPQPDELCGLSPVQLPQREGVGADGHGFAGAEAGHADADALQGVVLHLLLAAGHGDCARLTFEEGLQLRRVLQVEGGRGQPAELVALRAGVGAVQLANQRRQEKGRSAGGA